METVAETKTTVDNQTAAAPQQYTIVPDDSKPIFEDDTLLCELYALVHCPLRVSSRLSTVCTRRV